MKDISCILLAVEIYIPDHACGPDCPCWSQQTQSDPEVEDQAEVRLLA